MDAELWIHFAKQVYVVGHHFQFDHCSPKFLSGLVDDLLQTHIHAVDQDLAAVFGAPDHMILAGIGHVTVGFIIRTHVLYYMAFAV
jgi:hypothetical protein